MTSRMLITYPIRDLPTWKPDEKWKEVYALYLLIHTKGYPFVGTDTPNLSKPIELQIEATDMSVALKQVAQFVTKINRPQEPELAPPYTESEIADLEKSLTFKIPEELSTYLKVVSREFVGIKCPVNCHALKNSLVFGKDDKDRHIFLARDARNDLRMWKQSEFSRLPSPASYRKPHIFLYFSLIMQLKKYATKVFDDAKIALMGKNKYESSLDEEFRMYRKLKVRGKWDRRDFIEILAHKQAKDAEEMELQEKRQEHPEKLEEVKPAVEEKPVLKSDKKDFEAANPKAEEMPSFEPWHLVLVLRNK